MIYNPPPSSSGSGLTFLLPTSGGLNQGTFIWPRAPVIIFSDNVPRQKTSTDTTPNWTGTTTTVLSTGIPNSDIFALG